MSLEQLRDIVVIVYGVVGILLVAVLIMVAIALLISVRALTRVIRDLVEDPLKPTLGEVQELYSIAAVVIGGSRITGGVGGIGRTLMGVFVLGILGNGLNLIQVSSYVQNIVIGTIIVGAVYVDMARERRH